MFARLRDDASEERLQSYLGLLKHGNTHKIKEKIVKNSMTSSSVIYG